MSIGIVALYAFTIFLQCCVFHYIAFHSILISSLWHNPIEFWMFYLPKISIAIFFASLCFIFPSRLYPIVVSAVFSIWMHAELIYYRANHIFMDGYTFTMVGNMDGFWSSVVVYFQWIDTLFYLPVILVVILFCTTYNRRNFSAFALFLFLSVSTHVGAYSLYSKQCSSTDINGNIIGLRLNPFKKSDVETLFFLSSASYVKSNSVVHALIYDVIRFCSISFERSVTPLTSEDNSILESLVSYEDSIPSPQDRLYILLVESLESWAITPWVMPNLYNFISSHDDLFYASHVISQVKGGTSADGQMIVNTGLLPITQGAACYRFPNNVYPSLSEVYSNSAFIQSGDLSIWNQKHMSDAYSIDTNYVVLSSDDAETFKLLGQICAKHDYVMSLTMASHSPFTAFSSNSSLILPERMPVHMANYLKSLHYTDSCMASFLEGIDSLECLSTATICITGDHTVFHDELRKEFRNYCNEFKLDYQVGDAFTACIIKSPKITEKRMCTEEVYQMDIYPTLRHLVAEGYYWKGFGICMLDSAQMIARPLAVDVAYMLSDKIIANNWFKTQRSGW